ncbi:hypothetical protein LPJ66_000742 [Kickxella alabastrina]|uniref:Uncharacterized protein n=1 Tax=Kickxella alabastrina TaxID=61397 RepID=A0ACC1IVA4_9FUNG|nr:hypothetical protein LPJ66_000742 [Kickxella alabastrina]
MHKVFLMDDSGIYECSNCGTHLAQKDQIYSKEYNGQYGHAYLFNKAINICPGEEDKRSMTTGVHIVRDISCMDCGKYVGWTYITAFERKQKFKEGKFILEKELINNVTQEWKL